MCIEEMEEGEGASSHEKEVEGLEYQNWQCRDRIQWTQGPRGARNIARNCEKPENRSAELQGRQ
jgi:hypothetical protein